VVLGKSAQSQNLGAFTAGVAWPKKLVLSKDIEKKIVAPVSLSFDCTPNQDCH